MFLTVIAASLSCGSIVAFAQDVATLLTHQRQNVLRTEWGVSGRKGKRDVMEDAYAVQESDEQMLFALFDGHRGTDAALTAARLLPDKIFKHGEHIAYVAVDEAIEQSGSQSGAAAVTARIIPQDNGRYELLLAWAGDSRAVLADEFGFPRSETIDHKPGEPSEQERIMQAGGAIYRRAYRASDGTCKEMYRVARPFKDPADTYTTGGLSLSRALGDAQWSNDIISPVPDVLTCTLKPGADGYLILASDGFWDTVSTAQASHIVARAYTLFKCMDQASVDRLADDSDAGCKDGQPTHEAGSGVSAILAARALRDVAYNSGSTDNITAMVVRFIWEQEQTSKHSGYEDTTPLQEFGGLQCCML